MITLDLTVCMLHNEAPFIGQLFGQDTCQNLRFLNKVNFPLGVGWERAAHGLYVEERTYACMSSCIVILDTLQGLPRLLTRYRRSPRSSTTPVRWRLCHSTLRLNICSTCLRLSSSAVWDFQSQRFRRIQVKSECSRCWASHTTTLPQCKGEIWSPASTSTQSWG